MPPKPTAAKPAAAPRQARTGKAKAGPATSGAAEITGLDDAPQVSASPGAAVRQGGALKLKDMIDQVAQTSGVKKKDVKLVVEAALTLMGAALGRGEAMSLPGLGHLRVARQATAASPVMTIKLRQGEGGKGKAKSSVADEKDTLAEDSDQG